MRIIFRTDVHMSDHAPASWKADYKAEVLHCLQQIGAMTEHADLVLDGGDFFHVKSPVRNSHNLMAEVAKLHLEHYKCPVWAIEGNHDLAYNNIETIGRQPLGVLFATEIFHQLRDRSVSGVRIVGFPYAPDRTLEELLSIRKRPEDKLLIAVAHILATENPSGALDDFFGETVFRYSDLIVDGGPDVWLFGHWHKDQGAVRIGSTWFINPGSVSRGALVQDNLQRVPKVALLDIDDAGRVDVRLADLQVMPAADAFDMERRERIEAEADDVGAFVNQLKEATFSDAGASIEDHLIALDFAQEVRDAAFEYLARAREVK